MVYRYLADAVVVFHLAFIAFVLAGGLLVLRRRRIMWAHLPAVAWGVFIELSHRICPLTPLENHLRRLGKSAGYQGGFVDHYITPVVYPNGLTRGAQVFLACLILAINVACYGAVVYRRRPGGLGGGGSRAAARRPAPAAPAVRAGEDGTDSPKPASTADDRYAASTSSQSA